MTRALSILAAVAALAVSAAPVGSAGTPKKPPQLSYSKAKAAAGGYGAHTWTAPLTIIVARDSRGEPLRAARTS
jgi:hypothetical protein